MTPDDEYWRWRDRMDDQNRLAELASENTRQLNEALRERNWDKARQLTGVPPPDAGHEGSDEPERTDPPTAGEQFREHKHALLFNLEWADPFLPKALLADWAQRVEPLDIEEPEAGAAAIAEIQEEYRRAEDRYEPPNSEVSRRIDWDYYVPRIGHEMEWLAALFRHVMTPW